MTTHKDIRNMYDGLKKAYGDKLLPYVRRRDISPLCGGMFGPGTQIEILKYARAQEYAKLEPPYKLADYLCYRFEGTEEQLAAKIGTTVQGLEELMYHGCYYHKGEVLQPLEFKSDMRDIKDFMARYLTISPTARVHTSTIWQAYDLHGGVKQPGWKKKLKQELIAVGCEQCSVLRIGDKVTTGFKGVGLRIGILV